MLGTADERQVRRLDDGKFFKKESSSVKVCSAACRVSQDKVVSLKPSAFYEAAKSNMREHMWSPAVGRSVQ